MECGTLFVRYGARLWPHLRESTIRVNPSLSWRVQVSSRQRGTSFRQSDVYGWQTECTAFLRWRLHPFFHPLLRMMISGGAHMLRKRFTCGTQWTTRIGRTQWLCSTSHLTGRFGKRKIRSGHQFCGKRAITSSSTYARTSNRIVGALKLRAGDGGAISEPPNLRNRSNAG